jgi:hypothetical protein
VGEVAGLLTHLEHVSFGELLVAGDFGSEGEEGQEVARFAFVADGRAPVAGQPGDRSFDGPPVAAEFIAGFNAFAAMRGMIPRRRSQSRSAGMS